jgi:hypothetical protein
MLIFFWPICHHHIFSPGIVKLRRLSDGKFMQKLVHISRLKLAQVRTPLEDRIPQENDPMEADDIRLDTPETPNNQETANTDIQETTPLTATKISKPITSQQDVKRQANKEIAKPDRAKLGNTASTTIPQALKINTAKGQLEYLPIKTINDVAKSQGKDMQLRIVFKDKTMRWLPITALNDPAREMFYKLKLKIRNTPTLRERKD